jgi:hypothetical protein
MHVLAYSFALFWGKYYAEWQTSSKKFDLEFVEVLFELVTEHAHPVLAVERKCLFLFSAI